MSYRLPELTSEEFDIADRIERALEGSAKWSTPSEIARAAKTDTATARRVLDYLGERQYIQVSGNGNRRRYHSK